VYTLSVLQCWGPVVGLPALLYLPDLAALSFHMGYRSQVRCMGVLLVSLSMVRAHRGASSVPMVKAHRGTSLTLHFYSHPGSQSGWEWVRYFYPGLDFSNGESPSWDISFCSTGESPSWNCLRSNGESPSWNFPDLALLLSSWWSVRMGKSVVFLHRSWFSPWWEPIVEFFFCSNGESPSFFQNGISVSMISILL
jgi:hypothetical protein